ncbi:MAG: hypothetical protein QW607_05730 [Desulfurococcaceae archaeon]
MRIPILGFVGEDEKESYIITQEQLERMISELLPNYSKNDSWFFDVYYRCMPVQSFGQFLISWYRTLSQLAYTKEFFDCDDFALLFSSLLRACYYPAGIVIGELYYKGEFVGYHAWNLLLFINKAYDLIKVYEFEPQTCEILLNHESKDNFKYNGRWVIW